MNMQICLPKLAQEGNLEAFPLILFTPKFHTLYRKLRVIRLQATNVANVWAMLDDANEVWFLSNIVFNTVQHLNKNVPFIWSLCSTLLNARMPIKVARWISVSMVMIFCLHLLHSHITVWVFKLVWRTNKVFESLDNESSKLNTSDQSFQIDTQRAILRSEWNCKPGKAKRWDGPTRRSKHKSHYCLWDVYCS